MIDLATQGGPVRAEGFPVFFAGWAEYRFLVHHPVDGGEIDEGRWIVSESRSGRALTHASYKTTDDAIAAAGRFLATPKRQHKVRLLERAVLA